jgi:hypothetical protein
LLSGGSLASFANQHSGRLGWAGDIDHIQRFVNDEWPLDRIYELKKIRLPPAAKLQVKVQRCAVAAIATHWRRFDEIQALKGEIPPTLGHAITPKGEAERFCRNCETRLSG